MGVAAGKIEDDAPPDQRTEQQRRYCQTGSLLWGGHSKKQNPVEAGIPRDFMEWPDIAVLPGSDGTARKLVLRIPGHDSLTGDGAERWVHGTGELE